MLISRDTLKNPYCHQYNATEEMPCTHHLEITLLLYSFTSILHLVVLAVSVTYQKTISLFLLDQKQRTPSILLRSVAMIITSTNKSSLVLIPTLQPTQDLLCTRTYALIFLASRYLEMIHNRNRQGIA